VIGRYPSSAVVYGVVASWVAVLFVAAGWGVQLDQEWPAWRTGLSAMSLWGVNLLLLYYCIGPPFTLSRIPMLSVTFALLMTVFGSASYWATTQLFPTYHVFIERAAVFIASCTLFSLIGCIVSETCWAGTATKSWVYVWDWNRLRLVTYVLFLACVVGTFVSIRRIGYVPAVQGDPESLRVEFPAIAGIWYRLSMLGIVVGLIAGAQVCGRRATWTLWGMGVLGLVCASLYGNRFFVALPAGACVLLWNQVRSRISARTVAISFMAGVPVFALFGFWRQQDTGVSLLGPIALVLYGTLSEFRDVGWTLDFYSGPHPLLHGSTLGGLFVPLLPSAVWSVFGVDKAAVFAHSNAAVLAQEMGQFAAQRIGIYGELFMNFGWIGSFVGALLYGMVVGYLDRRFLALSDGRVVGGVVLAVIAVAILYAQVGQWNMLTSTITSSCYPILLLALFAARRLPGSA